MMKFTRGHSVQSSTSSKQSSISIESSCGAIQNQSNQIDNHKNNCQINYAQSKRTRVLLDKNALETKLNTLLHHKLFLKLARKKKAELKFHLEASSLNSSCNDSVISSSGDSTVSRCTSSLSGERISVSELEFACSSGSSDNEEINKYSHSKSASIDHNINVNSNNSTLTISTNKDVVDATSDKLSQNRLAINNQSMKAIENSNHKALSQTNESFKVESKRRSILLSNQVTRHKSSSSITTTAPKLLLPKEVHENHDCCSKAKNSKTMVKFFTYSLRDDVEYKTLSISNKTTSKQVINILLDKFKMKHRDSNLFHVTMEIVIRKNGIPIRSMIRLNNEACPVQLKACYPNDEIRFLIENKPGALLRVYDSCLLSSSLYKSILVDPSTTVDELIQLMLNCYQSKDKATNYSLYVVDKLGSYKLQADELPSFVQETWDTKHDPIFQLRKTKEVNYNYLNKMFLIKRFSSHSLNSIVSSMIFQDSFYI